MPIGRHSCWIATRRNGWLLITTIPRDRATKEGGTRHRTREIGQVQPFCAPRGREVSRTGGATTTVPRNCFGMSFVRARAANLPARKHPPG